MVPIYDFLKSVQNAGFVDAEMKDIKGVMLSAHLIRVAYDMIFWKG